MIVLLTATGYVVPAGAATLQLPIPVSHEPSSLAHYCAGQVYSAGAGASVTVADSLKPARVDCFKTLADAYAYALGDPQIAQLGDEQVASLEGLNGPVAQEAAQSALPLVCYNCSGYTIGVDYQNWHWDASGGTLLWYASAYCSPGVTYYSGAMASHWNDTISSAHLSNIDKCNHWYHYHDGGYVGQWIDCGLLYGAQSGCYEMFSMNDQTSSEKWVG